MASTTPGRFVWFELLTKDPKAAIAFYSEVNGWKTQPFGEGYTMWVGSQGPLGGVAELPAEAVKAGAQPHWIGSVQVADVDATAALCKKLGGKITSEPTDIPTAGRYAVVTDPQGASISLFKPSGAMEQHDPAKEGEVCWSELMADDGTSAFEVYAKLFGWKQLDEMDMGEMGKYRIYGLGETRMGGMMTTPEGAPMPPTWIHYFSTSDLDATLARATRLRATVVSGPMEVPGGGKIAQLTDPQGALFALHQGPKT
jgi:predicted enzyme related to lactoylglutathione lyase